MAFAGGLLSDVKRFNENENSMFSEHLLTAGPRVYIWQRLMDSSYLIPDYSCSVIHEASHLRFKRY